MTCILLTPSDSFTFPLTCLAIKKRFATCEDDVLALTYRNGSKRDALYDFTDRIEKKLESEHIAGNLCCGLVAGIYGKKAVDPVTNNDFGSIVAGLILIFPEIRWYFPDVKGLPSIFDMSNKKQRSLFSPLFDADGIRSELIGKATKSKSTVELHPDCVVVEDELNFCFYYSYVAYRSGYRVLPVTSYTAFKDLKNWDDPPTVLIEDMSLAFFDREGEESLIELKDRDNDSCYGTISKEAKLRALVTIGQPASDQSDDYSKALENNLRYLQCCEKRKKIRTDTHIERGTKYFASEAKPVGGMFRLIEYLALEKFVSKKAENSESNTTGHSAPGMVQAIVEVMLSRVRRRRDREGLLDILLGGVLSIDALKLLGDKAPMLRFDALLGQHENEVRAESKFIDIGPVKDVKDRFKEIDEDVERIAEACQKEYRDPVRLQAQATLAHRMMLVFRNAAQYDEEMVCLNYLRKAQLHLSRLPWNFLLKGPRAYAEWLVSGGYWRPVAFMFLVPFLLSIFLSGVAALGSSDLSTDLAITSWKRVASSFFEAVAVPEEAVKVLKDIKGEGGSWQLLRPLIFGFSVVLAGVFHIGVFISFVFSRLMRR